MKLIISIIVIIIGVVAFAAFCGFAFWMCQEVASVQTGN
jgi:flagellar basal body-associated protein FliL